jgi:hypothetical protein
MYCQVRGHLNRVRYGFGKSLPFPVSFTAETRRSQRKTAEKAAAKAEGNSLSLLSLD